MTSFMSISAVAGSTLRAPSTGHPKPLCPLHPHLHDGSAILTGRGAQPVVMVAREPAAQVRALQLQLQDAQVGGQQSGQLGAAAVPDGVVAEVEGGDRGMRLRGGDEGGMRVNELAEGAVCKTAGEVGARAITRTAPPHSHPFFYSYLACRSLPAPESPYSSGP